MPTPSGTISLSDVNDELGNPSTAQISMNDTDVRLLADIKAGPISMDDLRDKSDALPWTLKLTHHSSIWPHVDWEKSPGFWVYNITTENGTVIVNNGAGFNLVQNGSALSHVGFILGFGTGDTTFYYGGTNSIQEPATGQFQYYADEFEYTIDDGSEYVNITLRANTWLYFFENVQQIDAWDGYDNSTSTTAETYSRDYMKFGYKTIYESVSTVVGPLDSFGVDFTYTAPTLTNCTQSNVVHTGAPTYNETTNNWGDVIDFRITRNNETTTSCEVAIPMYDTTVTEGYEIEWVGPPDGSFFVDYYG